MHNLCFFNYFFQKSLFTENYFLIAVINLATRGPLYTCLVFLLKWQNFLRKMWILYHITNALIRSGKAIWCKVEVSILKIFTRRPPWGHLRVSLHMSKPNLYQKRLSLETAAWSPAGMYWNWKKLLAILPGWPTILGCTGIYWLYCEKFMYRKMYWKKAFFSSVLGNILGFHILEIFYQLGENCAVCL